MTDSPLSGSPRSQEPALRFKDDAMRCSVCCSATPHRLFGDVWRCSQCGGVTSVIEVAPAAPRSEETGAASEPTLFVVMDNTGFAVATYHGPENASEDAGRWTRDHSPHRVVEYVPASALRASSEKAERLERELRETEAMVRDYERWQKEDAAKISAAESRVTLLLRFAGRALEESRVIDIGDWDGGSIQDAMVECGLLQPFTVEARCGESCECDVGCICYRPTALATSALSAARAARSSPPAGPEI